MPVTPAYTYNYSPDVNLLDYVRLMLQDTAGPLWSFADQEIQGVLNIYPGNLRPALAALAQVAYVKASNKASERELGDSRSVWSNRAKGYKDLLDDLKKSALPIIWGGTSLAPAVGLIAPDDPDMPGEVKQPYDLAGLNPPSSPSGTGPGDFELGLPGSDDVFPQ